MPPKQQRDSFPNKYTEAGEAAAAMFPKKAKKSPKMTMKPEQTKITMAKKAEKRKA